MPAPTRLPLTPDKVPSQAPAARGPKKAAGTLYAPAGGLLLRGRFYQGGEPLDIKSEEDRQALAGVAHADRGLAQSDFLRKPSFSKGELKGQGDVKRKKARVNKNTGKVTPYVAPRAVPSVGKDESPHDPPLEAPALGGLGRTSRGDITREHLPQELHQHLDDSEVAQLTADSARQLVEQLNSLPPDEEYAQAALGGVAKRGWYSRSQKALEGLFGEEAPRFAALLAATSPQSSPRDNLRNALYIWGQYVGLREAREAAGRDGLTEQELLAHLKTQRVTSDRMRDKGEEGARLKSMTTSFPAAAKALTVADPDRTGYISLFPTGPKIDSFRQNLQGESGRVTNDLWQARLGGVDEGTINKVGNYLANAVKVRRVAALLNRRFPEGQKWTPAEVQETTWSFIRALAMVGARSRDNPDTTSNRGTAFEGLQGKPLNGEKALAALTHEMVAESGDFLTLLAKDPQSRAALESLGLGDNLSRTLKAYKASQARKAAKGGTPRGPVVPGNLAGPARDANASIARRAAQHVPSFQGAKGRSKYARVVDSQRIKSYNGSMTRIKLAAPPALTSRPSPGPTPARPQAQVPTGAEGGPESATAFTDNAREDLTFPEALARTRSSNHAAFKSIVRGVSAQLGLKGTTSSAVGDWEDGAEHGVLQTIPHPADPEVLKYAAAWYGLLGNQRAVMLFHPDPKGVDSLYTIDLKGMTDVGKVRAALQQAQVPFRTLVPGHKGTKVVIYDQDRQWRDRVAQFAGAHNAVIRESVGQGSYIGGASRAAARAKYRDIITAYEAQHAQAGGGTLRAVGEARGSHSLGNPAGQAGQARQGRLQARGGRVRLGRTHAEVAREQADPQAQVAQAAIRAAWVYDHEAFRKDPTAAVRHALAWGPYGFAAVLSRELGGQDRMKELQDRGLLAPVLEHPEVLGPYLTPESLSHLGKTAAFKKYLSPQMAGLPGRLGGNEAATSLWEHLTRLRYDDPRPEVNKLARAVMEGDHEMLGPALDAAEESGHLQSEDRPALEEGVRTALADPRFQVPQAPLGKGQPVMTSQQAMLPQMRTAAKARTRGLKSVPHSGLPENPSPEPQMPIRPRLAATGVRLKFSAQQFQHLTPRQLLHVAQDENGLWYAYPTGHGSPPYTSGGEKGTHGMRASGGYDAPEPALDAARELETSFLKYSRGVGHSTRPGPNRGGAGGYGGDKVMLPNARKGVRLKLSGVNAPPGGVIVRGLFYQGGHFIPSAELEKSTWDQYQTVADRRAKVKMARRADGSYDFGKAQEGQQGPQKLAKTFHARDLVPTEPDQHPEPSPAPRAPRPQAPAPRSRAEQPADPAKVAQAREAARQRPADPLSMELSTPKGETALGAHPTETQRPTITAPLPQHATPEQARQYISRLYNVARDFDSDVEARTTGMTAYEHLLKRHALWHDILRAEAEYRNRGESGQFHFPGVGKVYALPHVPYTPEEQQQILQRRNDSRAIYELARHGLIDFPEGAREGQLLADMHAAHLNGHHENGRLAVHSLGELANTIHHDRTAVDSRAVENAAYDRLGSPVYQLISGQTKPLDVDEAIQQIRDYGIPLNPERARQAWAAERQEGWTLPSTGTFEDPNHNPHL